MGLTFGFAVAGRNTPPGEGQRHAEIAGKLMRLFVELNKVGTTIIIATHNEQLTSSYNYQRINLSDGTARLYPALKHV